jgi:hypothetical protein
LFCLFVLVFLRRKHSLNRKKLQFRKHSLGPAPRTVPFVDVPCEDGTTPLHLACALGLGRVAALLLTSGADTTATDAQGRTPGARVPPGSELEAQFPVWVAEVARARKTKSRGRGKRDAGESGSNNGGGNSGGGNSGGGGNGSGGSGFGSDTVVPAVEACAEEVPALSPPADPPGTTSARALTLEEELAELDVRHRGNVERRRGKQMRDALVELAGIDPLDLGLEDLRELRAYHERALERVEHAIVQLELEHLGGDDVHRHDSGGQE